MRVNRRIGLCLLLLGIGYAAVIAAQEALSEEFLEYLGNYEQVGGEWVDPFEFAQALEQMANLSKASATNSEIAEKVDSKKRNETEEANNEKDH